MKSTTLYLGLRPPVASDVVHYPVISIEALAPPSDTEGHVSRCTHLIVTSRTSAEIFPFALKDAAVVVPVGAATARAISTRGWNCLKPPKSETAEGLVELLDKMLTPHDFCVWPHSALSRPLIGDFLQAKQIPHYKYIAYRTRSRKPGPPPNLKDFETIVFTSPSTVEGFLKIYGKLPELKKCKAIGPVTAQALQDRS